MSVVAAVAGLLGSGFLLLANGLPYARSTWKDRALAGISRRAADTNWLGSEISRLHGMTNSVLESDRWLSPQLILMTNGEWMVYRSICRKENFWVRDLFLGRASDGRWYYSTYHFCINMCALGRMGEGQPSSLADFAQTYYLKPFDGRSDECLQSTWPPRRMTER